MKMLYLSSSLFIFMCDRLTKMAALQLVDQKVINNYLSFGLTFNRGINWGLLNSSNATLFMFLNCVIAFVILGLIAYAWSLWRTGEQGTLIFGCICIITGALSNYIDRLWYGGVIDFIIISFGSWSWPAFNVADCAILFGLGLMIFETMKK